MRIIIAGGGLKTIEHMTIEVLEAMLVSSKVFVLYHDIKVVESLCRWYYESRNYNTKFPEFISLDQFYKKDVLRIDNYNRATSNIINSLGSDTIGVVCYLTQGNPIAFDSVTQILQERAKSNGYTITMLPGISSLDTVLLDLGIEIAPGIQIYDSSCIVGQNLIPRTDLSCILLQLNVFGTGYISKGKKIKTGTLKLLQDYLLQHYPESHKMNIVRSESSFTNGTIYDFTLLDMDKLDQSLLYGSCLFIPPLTSPKMSKEFEALLGSQEFFEKNYH